MFRRFYEKGFFVGYLNWRNFWRLQLIYRYLQFLKVTPVQITYKKSLFVKSSKHCFLVINHVFLRKISKLTKI